jgi:hypothetical protein
VLTILARARKATREEPTIRRRRRSAHRARTRRQATTADIDASMATHPAGGSTARLPDPPVRLHVVDRLPNPETSPFFLVPAPDSTGPGGARWTS